MAYNFLESDLGKMLNHFFCKKGDLQKGWNVKVIHNYMGFHYSQSVRNNAYIIDKYMFSLYKKPALVKSLLDVSIPKHVKLPWIKYLKPIKDKESDYKFILDELARINNWSDRELKLYTSQIIEELEKDKTQIKELLIQLGADDTVWRKLKVKKSKFVEKEIKSKKRMMLLSDFC